MYFPRWQKMMIFGKNLFKWFKMFNSSFFSEKYHQKCWFLKNSQNVSKLLNAFFTEKLMILSNFAGACRLRFWPKMSKFGTDILKTVWRHRTSGLNRFNVTIRNSGIWMVEWSWMVVNDLEQSWTRKIRFLKSRILFNIFRHNILMSPNPKKGYRKCIESPV